MSREYMHFSAKNDKQYSTELLSELSPELRGEVVVRNPASLEFVVRNPASLEVVVRNRASLSRYGSQPH